jgi:HlyD family secretion protein
MIAEPTQQDRALPRAWVPRRRIAWGLAVLLSLALLAWAGQAWRDAAGASVSLVRLSVAEVSIGPLLRDVAGEGKVVAAVSPTLYAGSAGAVALLVQAGDPVRVGQVLARISSAELAARLAQESAQADALRTEWLRAEADSQQQRAQATAQVETAGIAHRTAGNDLLRQTQAFEAGATARMQVDQAQDAVARAQVALTQAQALARSRDEVSRFELQAKRQAFERQQLLVKELLRQQDELAVRSPVQGQVGQLFVSERMAVAKDAKLMTVVDLSQLEVQMQVAESLARELRAGMPGDIQTSGQRYAGRVSSISPEVVANEVAARLRFEGATPGQLRQNQRLSVRVQLEQRERVLQLPRGPFVDEGGGRVAYVLRGDGQAERRNIRLGVQSLDKVEVLEGLKPGERVVISGAEHFKGAALVRVAQ